RLSSVPTEQETKAMGAGHDRSKKQPAVRPSSPQEGMFSYDDDWRMSAISSKGARATLTYTCHRKPQVAVEHVREKGVFRLTAPDGKTEVFRDDATRYLVVEPDPETGEMTPVIRGGQPKFLYLCREEREVR